MTEHEPLLPLSDSQRESLNEAVTAYEEALTATAARHLQARGVTRETAATFRLGSVREALPGHARYLGYLAIPYLDKQGEPVSLRFRCLEDHDHRAYGHGKYMSITDEPARVFNVRAIHEAVLYPDGVIHVTEGEFDAITLNQIGLPAVAIPGASGFQPHHRRMLAGFNRVWVWGDPDDAGADFTNRVCRMMRAAKGVRLVGGDVSEMYVQGGAEALLELIDQTDRSAA